MRGIVVKWFLIVVIAFCGQDAISQELDSEREGSSLFLQRPSLQLRAGFTGSYWNPKGIDPYQLDTYGRTYAYVDVAAMHPLLFLGEGFDLISIP
ncbi:hypothetical protein K8I28_13465, partial [bacterium]|nr:hypothetical protein [bacterium]